MIAIGVRGLVVRAVFLPATLAQGVEMIVGPPRIAQRSPPGPQAVPPAARRRVNRSRRQVAHHGIEVLTRGCAMTNGGPPRKGVVCRFSDGTTSRLQP